MAARSRSLYSFAKNGVNSIKKNANFWGRLCKIRVSFFRSLSACKVVEIVFRLFPKYTPKSLGDLNAFCFHFKNMEILWGRQKKLKLNPSVKKNRYLISVRLACVRNYCTLSLCTVKVTLMNLINALFLKNINLINLSLQRLFQFMQIIQVSLSYFFYFASFFFLEYLKYVWKITFLGTHAAYLSIEPNSHEKALIWQELTSMKIPNFVSRLIGTAPNSMENNSRKWFAKYVRKIKDLLSPSTNCACLSQSNQEEH